MRGDVVQALFTFYSRTWGIPQDVVQPVSDGDASQTTFDNRAENLTLIPSTAHHRTEFEPQHPVPTLILPSSYHRNPDFRPFPWQSSATPPRTPLNTALLLLFEQARRSIYIQTPNITCDAVIAALLGALARGVDVTIVTNRNMMVLEQLVTAGTTTAWSLRSFIRRFEQLKAVAPGGSAGRHGEGATWDSDLEAGRRVGHLRISYFRAKSQSAPGEGSSEAEEPVHSHLKLTVVDSEYTVLGSGNLDRASFFTSQELGLMFYGQEFCAGVKAGVDSVLEGRLGLVYDSDDVRSG
jgi:phosphatidylserine/phosphatidylglycerophosphate/cardiolipin synthase-like enzyme